MEYKKFLYEVKECVRKRVPAEYKVVINTVIKNNDLKFDAITIYKENQRIIPNVFVNRYYEEYLKGKTLDMIADEIINIYKSNKHPYEYVSDIGNLESISKQIFYRLVNRKMNSERLQEMPFKEIGDLVKIYQVMEHMDEDGISSFTISNDMMEKWKVDIDTIDDYATENTQTLFPVTLKCLSDLIREMLFGSEKETIQDEKSPLNDKELDGEIKMYVLSNKFGINGASAILYKDMLKNFATQVNSDLYILPSSIHEVIIIPATDKLKVSNLKEMVVDVNQKEVAAGEVLSNEVYFYDLNKDELRIAED